MYQSQVKALAWVPPLARCQSSLFSFQAFPWEQGVRAPKSTEGDWSLGWFRRVPRAALRARLVPSFLCHHQSLRAITTHHQFLEIRPRQLGEESLWYSPAVLSKYAITIILWTSTAPSHTRVRALHKHSFPKPHTTHWGKHFFYKPDLPNSSAPILPTLEKLFSLRERTAVPGLPLQIPMASLSNAYPAAAPKCLCPGLVHICTYEAQTTVNFSSPAYNPQGPSQASRWEFFWQSEMSSRPP